MELSVNALAIYAQAAEEQNDDRREGERRLLDRDAKYVREDHGLV